MTGKLNKLSKSLTHLSDPMSSTPFGDIVSLMTVLPAVTLPCLSTRHLLSQVRAPQILKAHSSLHSSLCDLLVERCLVIDSGRKAEGKVFIESGSESQRQSRAENDIVVPTPPRHAHT